MLPLDQCSVLVVTVLFLSVLHPSPQMGENLKHFKHSWARAWERLGCIAGKIGTGQFSHQDIWEAKGEPAHPCLTCISPQQNVQKYAQLQIVENLTPNKANLTQVACKSQKNVPLNLFKLGQQVPSSTFYTHEYKLSSQQVFSLNILSSGF